MAVTKVVENNSEIDGKPIKWFTLEITGYVESEFETLSLKLSKTEAMLARLLLKGENKPEVQSRKATDDEQKAFLAPKGDPSKINLDDENE